MATQFKIPRWDPGQESKYVLIFIGNTSFSQLVKRPEGYIERYMLACQQWLRPKSELNLPSNAFWALSWSSGFLSGWTSNDIWKLYKYSTAKIDRIQLSFKKVNNKKLYGKVIWLSQKQGLRIGTLKMFAIQYNINISLKKQYLKDIFNNTACLQYLKP